LGKRVSSTSRSRSQVARAGRGDLVSQGENELSDWELRVQKFRVFYDVLIEPDRRTVKVKAVGHKEHNILYVGGKEVQL
jgi:mRNA-degrading endonuclease RelE of RelBE toxin-antitoxin system